MSDPSRYRDSTQIVIPCESIEGLRERIEAEFTVTVFSKEGQSCRIIGSPVEIKAVSDFLSRHGVTVQ